MDLYYISYLDKVRTSNVHLLSKNSTPCRYGHDRLINDWDCGFQIGHCELRIVDFRLKATDKIPAKRVHSKDRISEIAIAGCILSFIRCILVYNMKTICVKGRIKRSNKREEITDMLQEWVITSGVQVSENFRVFSHLVSSVYSICADFCRVGIILPYWQFQESIMAVTICDVDLGKSFTTTTVEIHNTI